jgi:hypothetical protein
MKNSGPAAAAGGALASGAAASGAAGSLADGALASGAAASGAAGSLAGGALASGAAGSCGRSDGVGVRKLALEGLARGGGRGARAREQGSPAGRARSLRVGGAARDTATGSAWPPLARARLWSGRRGLRGRGPRSVLEFAPARLPRSRKGTKTILCARRAGRCSSHGRRAENVPPMGRADRPQGTQSMDRHGSGLEQSTQSMDRHGSVARALERIGLCLNLEKRWISPRGRSCRARQARTPVARRRRALRARGPPPPQRPPAAARPSRAAGAHAPPATEDPRACSCTARLSLIPPPPPPPACRHRRCPRWSSPRARSRASSRATPTPPSASRSTAASGSRPSRAPPRRPRATSCSSPTARRCVVLVARLGSWGWESLRRVHAPAFILSPSTRAQTCRAPRAL